MTSAVTNVAMPPAPVFAYNAEPPMADDGIAAPAAGGADGTAAGTTGRRDPLQSEDTKSAQIGVQVPNALLGILIANTNQATAPHTDPAAAFASFAMDAAAPSQSADNESAGSSAGSPSDSGASDSGSPVSEAGIIPQGTDGSPNTKTSPPVHIIPSWHVIPRMRII